MPSPHARPAIFGLTLQALTEVLVQSWPSLGPVLAQSLAQSLASGPGSAPRSGPQMGVDDPLGRDLVEQSSNKAGPAARTLCGRRAHPSADFRAAGSRCISRAHSALTAAAYYPRTHLPPMAQSVAAAPGTADAGQTDKHFWALVLGSLGVVFGDIGTSPLYALREAVKASTGGPEAVPGILSLMVWTMLLIVTLKYVLVLLNADNKGEGGTFALMALGQSVAKRSASLILMLGVIGAAFFYGEAVITPAISVLSAVEGLQLAAPQLERIAPDVDWAALLELTVLPVTVAILVGLFVVQSRGTAKVAQFFGPVMLIWFAVLAVGGLVHLIDDPRVFLALNPWL